MFALSPLTEAQLRSFSDEHVAPEAMSLFLAGRIMTTFERPSSLGGYGIQTAVTESFVIHLRSMIDFFYLPRPQATDIVAGQIFAGWESMRPDASPALEAARLRAHREIAELTTLRIAGTPPNKPWQSQPLLQEMRALIEKFLAGASDRRLGMKARLTLRNLVDRDIDLDAAVVPGVNIA
jgi:hypothetical protein